jgi:hypothetical protein
MCEEPKQNEAEPTEEILEPSLAFKRIMLVFKCIVGLWTIIGLALLLIILIDLCFYPLAKKKRRSRYHCPEAIKAMESSKKYYKENKKVKKDWQPYVYWRRARFDGKYINILKGGLRKTWNKEYPANDKKLKIFMFGGSTMWGEGAPDDFTIPSCLSKDLAKAGIKAEVVNYGENGYVQTQELITFIRVLQSGKRPDVVIYYDGVNDAFSSFQNLEAGSIQNSLRFKTHKYFNADTVKPKDALVMTIKRFSRISRYMKRRKENELFVAQNWLPENKMPALAEDTMRVCLTNMQILKALSIQYKFKLLCFLQPTLYTKENLRDYEQKIFDMYSNERDFTRLVYAKIAGDKRFKAIPYFYNLQRVFDHADKAIYIDFCHVNKYGNEMVAQAMLKDLMKQLKLKRSK